MVFKMEQLMGIGTLLIIIGFIAIFIGSLNASKDSKTKVAVGGFIGFIPFGFGNDKNLVWLATIISVVMVVLWFIFNARMLGK